MVWRSQGALCEVAMNKSPVIAKVPVGIKKKKPINMRACPDVSVQYVCALIGAGFEASS